MTPEQKVIVAAQLAAALITTGQVQRGSGSGTVEQWAAKVFDDVFKALPTLPGVNLGASAP
jgi:hypothetical protein